jgi:hypothetical protein
MRSPDHHPKKSVQLMFNILNPKLADGERSEPKVFLDELFVVVG